jgi:hypothetical protein
VGGRPAAPDARREPEAVAPDKPGEMVFTPPAELQARAHADRLRAAPGDAALTGYPTDVVQRALADVALQPGAKPVVVLFYADNARASHLQASELLPMLVRWREKIDVVPVDVSAAAQARWTAAERKLVRSYYLSYVPTTVVLSAERKPLLLQYQRVSAAMVEAALSAPPR